MTTYYGIVINMAHTTVKVKRWGNSFGVIIPQKVAKALEINEGEVLDVDIEKKARIDGYGIFKGAKPFIEQEEHEDLA